LIFEWGGCGYLGNRAVVLNRPRGTPAEGSKNDPSGDVEFRCSAAKKLSIIFLSMTKPPIAV